MQTGVLIFLGRVRKTPREGKAIYDMILTIYYNIHILYIILF